MARFVAREIKSRRSLGDPYHHVRLVEGAIAEVMAEHNVHWSDLVLVRQPSPEFNEEHTRIMVDTDQKKGDRVATNIGVTEFEAAAYRRTIEEKEKELRRRELRIEQLQLEVEKLKDAEKKKPLPPIWPWVTLLLIGVWGVALAWSELSGGVIAAIAITMVLPAVKLTLSIMERTDI